MLRLAMPADRIKAARELLGLSQIELAGAAGVSQGLISQMERGQKDVSDSTLRAIAEGTGLPWRFFEKSPDGSRSDSLRFRKYRTASMRDTTRARRTFIELADAMVELMDWAAQPPAALPTANARGLVDSQIEALATATRHVLGIDHEKPIRHLTRTLENAHVPIAPIVFTDLAAEETDEVAAIGHFGLSTRAGEKERSLIGYFPSIGARQRFTLAHEVGHLVLHAKGEAGGVDEAEADRFAGSLLMPKSAGLRLLGKHATLRDYALLKAEWGLSVQALIMRAYHLGRIDAARRTSLYKQLSARGWRRAEPVIVKNEDPILLGTLLRRRYGSSPNLYVRAAEAIGLPPVQLRSMMPWSRQRPAMEMPGESVAPVIELRRPR